MSIFKLKSIEKKFISISPSMISSKDESRILEMVPSSLNDPLDFWRQITFIIFPSPTGPFSFSFLMLVDTGSDVFWFIGDEDPNDMADVAEDKQFDMSQDFIIMGAPH